MDGTDGVSSLLQVKCAEIAALRAEVERLRSLQEVRHVFDLMAINARLRTALEGMVDAYTPALHTMGDTAWSKARAALAGEGK